MKIFIAVHHFPPDYVGGAEWRAYRTAHEMMARGHQVQVVCVRKIDQPVSGDLEWEDEEFEGVNVRRLAYNIRAAKDLFKMQYDNQWIGEHVEALLRAGRPDVFHLIGGYLMSGSVLLAAKRLAVPTVVSLTDFWFLCPRLSFLRSSGDLCSTPVDAARCARCLGEDSRRWRIPGKIFPAGMDFIWRLRRKKVSLHAERRRYLVETLNQVNIIVSPSEFLRCTYMEAGIDPHRIIFSRQGRYPVTGMLDLAKSNQNGRPLQIGYIGQINYHKGVHVLLDAVRMLPDAPIQLKLYGEYSNSEAYNQQIISAIAADSRVDHAGVFPRGDLSKVMNELDVIVVPSIWYENSPNTILEALAYKKPVIATNLGGMAELIDHNRNGLLFERGDSHSLKLQIKRLVDEPHLLDHLRQGIEPVKGVTEEMNELEGIYAGLAV